MASDRFNTVNDLETGDKIRISFSGNDPVEVGGVEFPNPWEATVGGITEDRKDPREGDDVRHVEFHRTVRLASPDGVSAPDRVEFKTAHRMEQDNTLNLTYKELIEDSPGHYRHHSLGFEDIEVIR